MAIIPTTVFQRCQGPEETDSVPLNGESGPVPGGNAHLWLRGITSPRTPAELRLGEYFLLASRTLVRRKLARFRHLGSKPRARHRWGVGLSLPTGGQMSR